MSTYVTRVAFPTFVEYSHGLSESITNSIPLGTIQRPLCWMDGPSIDPPSSGKKDIYRWRILILRSRRGVKHVKECLWVFFCTSDLKFLFYLFRGLCCSTPPGKLSKSPFKTPNFWEQTPVSTPRPEPGLSLLCVCWMLTQGIVVRNRGRHAGLGFQQALPVLRQIFDLPHKVDRQAAALWEGSEVFLT